ncbi:MAG TPA: ParB/RepB/Spo0J family partition protein [Methylomirabilota bacterium]|nr:ParB/RepB/Spo0J family partition protein [Methylomirabilota bacterium]
MSKPALGRGLGALLGHPPANQFAAPAAAPTLPPPPAAPLAPALPTDTRERVLRVKLDRIQPSPLQPRKDFTTEALQELAASIKEQGIVQPLIVRDKQTHYELIAGERRWRAAQLINLAEVPVIVREADDRSVLELALIENLQRENLNPMEEALGYSQLLEQFQLRQEDVATKVGKSRVAVANALRLLKLSPEVQAYVRDGRLSVGHAKVILSLPLLEHQKLAAERVLKNALSVRQTEELTTLLQNQSAAPATKTTNNLVIGNRDANVVSLENKVRERFGTKVQLRYRGGKGALEIKFFNDADLERILSVIGVKVD